MMDDRAPALAVVLRQLQELEVLKRQTTKDLKTVAGTERVAQWKIKTTIKTAAPLAETVGRQEGRTFAAIEPSLSFTNDLVEEFTDAEDCHHTSLITLARRLAEFSSGGD
ncbi:MAG: hypothetical protein NZM29_09090 [Nitrospira sp.]|nr:hypothetical protein [Nitrospira sp.]